VCSYDLESGLKLHYNQFFLSDLRQKSDEICQAHGLNVLKKYNPSVKSQRLGPKEYRAAMNGNSWKMALRVAIDFCMTRATNKDEFQREMKKIGYDMACTPERKYITYICPTQNGKECRVRDIKLNDEKYLKENMENEFRIRQEILTGRDNRNEPTDSQNGADSRGRMGRNNLHPGANADFDRRYMSGEESNGIGVEGAQGNGEKFAFEADRNLRQTGWESKREGCFKNRTEKDYGRPFMGSSVGAHGNTNDFGIGIGSLYGLVPLIDNDGNKTPEEIEAEERARIAASNMGAIIGAGILIAEALTDQSDPDEDDGFTIKM
jgi:hypothetical protein